MSAKIISRSLLRRGNQGYCMNTQSTVHPRRGGIFTLISQISRSEKNTTCTKNTFRQGDFSYNTYLPFPNYFITYYITSGPCKLSLTSPSGLISRLRLEYLRLGSDISPTARESRLRLEYLPLRVGFLACGSSIGSEL